VTDNKDEVFCVEKHYPALGRRQILRHAVTWANVNASH
jgi:hypothetical protein